MEAKRLQVLMQCKAVAHMAKAIAEVYDQRSASPTPDYLLDIVGQRTASMMEQLGNMLNGMDAVIDDDKWMNPIFAGARKLWPCRSGQTSYPLENQ